MPIPLAVLIVEDVESDAQLIVRLLKKADYDVTYEQVETADQMLSALEKRTWDIVISDYSLPRFDGLNALGLLKARQQDIPFIVVTGNLGEESAVSMMKAGAHDYLMKDNLARLAPAVARELEQAQGRIKRKQAEEALRESEERLAAVVEGSQLGYSDWNFRTGVVHRNERWAGMLGYTLEEIKPTYEQWEDLIHPDDLLSARQAMQDHLDGKTPIHRDEYRLRAKDGSYRWILDQGKIVEYDLQGRPLRMTATHTDITELKQVEDQLRQLSSAVEHSPIAIMITDVDGKIEYVNPKFTATNGYTLEELRGQTPRVLKSGQTPPEVYEQLWQTILSGKEWRGEFLNRRKDGQLYWEYASISAIVDSKGGITHFISVNEDITTRKESEEKIKRLNAGLEQLAMTDYLTSLYNRRYFMQRGTEECKRVRRTKQPLALLMLDIDKFKSVNDTYGHEIGDMTLQQVAAVLKANLREVDIIGRIGGEEFAVLLPQTSLDEAVILAERIRKAITSTTFETSSRAINITICVGVAAYMDEVSSIDDLLRNADVALYSAKHRGRNRVMKYSPDIDKAHDMTTGLGGR